MLEARSRGRATKARRLGSERRGGPLEVRRRPQGDGWRRKWELAGSCMRPQMMWETRGRLEGRPRVVGGRLVPPREKMASTRFRQFVVALTPTFWFGKLLLIRKSSSIPCPARNQGGCWVTRVVTGRERRRPWPTHTAPWHFQTPLTLPLTFSPSSCTDFHQPSEA